MARVAGLARVSKVAKIVVFKNNNFALFFSLLTANVSTILSSTLTYNSFKPVYLGFIIICLEAVVWASEVATWGLGALEAWNS